MPKDAAVRLGSRHRTLPQNREQSPQQEVELCFAADALSRTEKKRKLQCTTPGASVHQARVQGVLLNVFCSQLEEVHYQFPSMSAKDVTTKGTIRVHTVAA